jgi:cyclic pyranopterin phosphate synthase
MPKEVFDKSYAFLPQSSLLNFEEMLAVARLFGAHGVQQIPHRRRAAARGSQQC